MYDLLDFLHDTAPFVAVAIAIALMVALCGTVA